MDDKDVAIPVAYPDYLIAVDTPQIEVKLPTMPGGIDVFPHAIRIRAMHNKVPELGHAGILYYCV